MDPMRYVLLLVSGKNPIIISANQPSTLQLLKTPEFWVQHSSSRTRHWHFRTIRMEFKNIFPASYGSSRVKIPENGGFVRGVGPIDSHEFYCKKLRLCFYAIYTLWSMRLKTTHKKKGNGWISMVVHISSSSMKHLDNWKNSSYKSVY